jgi:hypothetical protein
LRLGDRVQRPGAARLKAKEGIRMRLDRGWFLAIATVLISLGAGGAARAQTVQWDIISITNFNPVTVNGGGVATAFAQDGSHITMTGSGTFVVATPTMVTGGGVWIIRDPVGNVTGLGTYQVTELITWNEAPGTLPPNAIENVVKQGSTSGEAFKLADDRGGVAVLRITYSDGSRGLLVVHCHLPVGGPPTIPEGISATKGMVNFWFIPTPVPLVDAGRTQFNILAPAP